jgi:hypothetical protein
MAHGAAWGCNLTVCVVAWNTLHGRRRSDVFKSTQAYEVFQHATQEANKLQHSGLGMPWSPH